MATGNREMLILNLGCTRTCNVLIKRETCLSMGLFELGFRQCHHANHQLSAVCGLNRAVTYLTSIFDPTHRGCDWSSGLGSKILKLWTDDGCRSMGVL